MTSTAAQIPRASNWHPIPRPDSVQCTVYISNILQNRSRLSQTPLIGIFLCRVRCQNEISQKKWVSPLGISTEIYGPPYAFLGWRGSNLREPEGGRGSVLSFGTSQEVTFSNMTTQQYDQTYSPRTMVPFILTQRKGCGRDNQHINKIPCWSSCLSCDRYGSLINSHSPKG